MATNQTRQIRTLHTQVLNVQVLPQEDILQLIQSETVAGALADVGGLQIGDIVSITGEAGPGVIDSNHDELIAPEDEQVSRTFLVSDIQGLPGSVPAQRHVLIELSTVQTLFW